MSTDANQAAVARAWRLVFGAASLAADGTLADEDVCSIRLLRLVFHLEATLGRTLPLDAFRGARRPGEFVGVLDGLAGKPAGGGAAVFLFPGMGGDDPNLLRLRARLAPALEVGMILYPDWPEQDPQKLDFDALIEFTVAQVITRAPDGPLRLAGYSLGGILAYGAALRLVGRGRVVTCLGIIDSTWLSVPRWAPLYSPARLLRFAAALRGGNGLPSAGNFAARLMQRLAPDAIGRIGPRRMRLPLDFGFYFRRALLAALHLQSLSAWQARIAADPPPLDVEAILFRSYEHDLSEPAALGWRNCCPRLRVALVRGGHHGMLAPDNIGGFCSAFMKGMGFSGDRE